jgi:hypothetical protein
MKKVAGLLAVSIGAVSAPPAGATTTCQYAGVRSDRQRLGFRKCWSVAMSTVSVWSGGVLPFAQALYWWVCGVPSGRVDQAARGSSRWDRMTGGQRRLYIVATSACILVIVAALFVVIISANN